MTIAVAGMLVFAGNAQAADCGAFPRVSLWGKITHQSVQAYVAKFHRGDWQSYVSKWESQLKKIRDIDRRTSASLVPNHKIRLNSAATRLYISYVAQRVEIVKCLADQASSRNTKSAMIMR